MKNHLYYIGYHSVYNLIYLPQFFWALKSVGQFMSPESLPTKYQQRNLRTMCCHHDLDIVFIFYKYLIFNIKVQMLSAFFSD